MGLDASFPDADFFRLRAAVADPKLDTGVELLNGGKTAKDGTVDINKIRCRAHATVKDENRDSDSRGGICDEWSREFYWEGLRRPTLIRFGRFGGNSDYTWSWKGGVLSGRNVDSHYNLFPLPQDDLNANRNLKQNPGY